MRLARQVYDQRIMLIIGATLRFVRNNRSTENIPVRLFVKQYGFTNNFSKAEELTVALKAMVNWVDRVRFERSVSPTPQAMLAFVKSRL